MSGPFYGSLAASASVFVAILTALLVNNYVRIKADQRQISRRLNSVQSDLEELQERRDRHQENVDSIREEWDEGYQEEAQTQVDEFIEKHLGDFFSKPIEKLTLNDLYNELERYAEPLEDIELVADENHYKDALQKRADEIESLILTEEVKSFATSHEGEGWNPGTTSFEERVQEKRRELDEIEEGSLDALGSIDRDPMTLQEFIQKYKDKHDISELRAETRDLLEEQYEDVVSKPKSPESNPFLRNSRQFGLDAAISPPDMTEQFEPGYTTDLLLGPDNTIDGVRYPEEQAEYEEARAKVRDIEAEIGARNLEIASLQQQLNRLQPDDLVDILFANVVTILFSVVVPMTAYLAAVQNWSLPVPRVLSHTALNVFVLWVIGLLVVFEAIYARISDRTPASYRLYRWLVTRPPLGSE